MRLPLEGKSHARWLVATWVPLGRAYNSDGREVKKATTMGRASAPGNASRRHVPLIVTVLGAPLYNHLIYCFVTTVATPYDYKRRPKLPRSGWDT